MYIPPVSNGRLMLGGIPAVDLAAEFGTPLYVYDAGVIRDRFSRLNSAIKYPDKRLHYAMKSNNNVRILELLRGLGACIDAVSAEEVAIALRAGFEPQKILFTGINLTLEDMRFAVEQNVMLNIGSLQTLELYGRNFPGTAVSLRVNPDVGAGHHDHCVTGGRESKFGVFESDIPRALSIAAENKLRLSGFHSHIGSGILDYQKFIDLMNVLMKLAMKFPDLDFIDFGGGIGVPYRPEEKDFSLDRFGQTVDRFMENANLEYGRKLTLALEPGRFPVAESGTLLVTCTDIKETPKYTFAGVNSGFNHLVRPMAYGSYHHILNATNPDGAARDYVVAGYICESGDVFTRTEKGIAKRAIPEIRVGDTLALLTAGAYGYAMSMNYNSRVRPAEVMVENGVAQLIRRRETVEDILKAQL